MKLKSLCVASALIGFLVTATPSFGAKLSTVGDVVGTVTLDPPVLAAGTNTYEFEAEGEISNLGHVEFLIFGSSTIDAMLNLTPLPPTTFVAITESGDTLFGIIRWNALTFDVGGYGLDGTYTIAGGTGQFAKAKGSGTGVGSLSPGTLELTLHLEGTVTEPKAPKKAKKAKKAGKK